MIRAAACRVRRPPRSWPVASILFSLLGSWRLPFATGKTSQPMMGLDVAACWLRKKEIGSKQRDCRDRWMATAGHLLAGRFIQEARRSRKAPVEAKL